MVHQLSTDSGQGHYLRGLSTGDFRPALTALLGEDAAGLSPATSRGATAVWEKEHAAFRRNSLEEHEYVR